MWLCDANWIHLSLTSVILEPESEHSDRERGQENVCQIIVLLFLAWGDSGEKHCQFSAVDIKLHGYKCAYFIDGPWSQETFIQWLTNWKRIAETQTQKQNDLRDPRRNGGVMNRGGNNSEYSSREGPEEQQSWDQFTASRREPQNYGSTAHPATPGKFLN